MGDFVSMESSASSSILCNSRFLLNLNHPPPSSYLLYPHQFFHHHSHFPPLSLTFSTTAAASILSFRPRVSNLNRLLVARSSPPGSSDSDCSPSGEQFAIILEVDGYCSSPPHLVFIICCFLRILRFDLFQISRLF